MTPARWTWEKQSKAYGNYGNANQWTVNAGLTSLARESCQNSADARQSDSADLVYSIITLKGDARRSFEEAIGWEGVLRPHLAAMTQANRGAVAAGQIKAGLEALDQSDRLMLLRIDDYGCKGLTGPEFPDADTDEDEFGNFIKLCRLDLFSGKAAASGGSFGLGKAVYWRFSALQTVLFNSVLADGDAVDGQTRNRVFGVNQGTAHRQGGDLFQGRGYFGLPDAEEAAQSIWGDEDLVDRLHLRRDDDRPGTSALVLAFHDPDNPAEQNETDEALVQRLTTGLRDGIEESFWPLLTRGGMKVRIDHWINGEQVSSLKIDPAEKFAELAGALRRFDEKKFDETLEKVGDVVVRDLPVRVSKRRSGEQHDSFMHIAKLVVTLSDEQRDGLEDKVCLFRQPEMVVQTIDKKYEGRRYHAFVVAGAAVNPGDPTQQDRWADDFLRFAEPPAHDRWIPSKGRGQASQVNLTANYVAPWIPNLESIEREVGKQLNELFDVIPVPDAKGPESVLRHLRFLHSQPGPGPGPGGAARKPVVEIVDWFVQDGRWHVEVEVQAKNRPEGWAFSPTLVLMGLDGKQPIKWDRPLEALEGCTTKDGRVLLQPTTRSRRLTARFRGVSTAELPIPAELSVVDIVSGTVAALEKEDKK
jgi:hypothetical protein